MNTKTVDKEVAKASEEAEELVSVDLPDDVKFRTPGFQRMRIDWRSDDRPVIEQARDSVEAWARQTFIGAYRILYDIYDHVREREVDENGEVAVNANGTPIWKKDAYGQYIEDYSRLSHRQKDSFLLSLTTNLVIWEQNAVDAWSEAMFAKAIWEERYAIGFDKPRQGTVDSRNAIGTIDARDERYFAILMSYRSKKADSLVKSMDRLAMRLKDSMIA